MQMNGPLKLGIIDMSDEMKLITALCEALGFEVVIDRDYQERKEVQPFARQYQSDINYPHTRGRKLEDRAGTYCIDENGKYTSRLIEPIKSYKLVKNAM